jgi:hypothetical protein
MPIQFLCPACSKPLSTARRKMGRAIVCPCCDQEIIVPKDAKKVSRHAPPLNNDDAALETHDPSVAMTSQVPAAQPVAPPMVIPVATPAQSESEADAHIAEFLIDTSSEQDRNPSSEESPHGAESVSSAHDASDVDAAVSGDLPEENGFSFSISSRPIERERPSKQRRPDVPEGMILYDRDVLYLQAVLIFVIATAMFIGGFLWGRFSAPDSDGTGFASNEEGGDGYLVMGRLRIESNRVPAPDQGAVAILIPISSDSSTPIPVDGLRPQDRPPGPNSRGLQKINELGGIFVKADAMGEFTVVLPRTGDYHVLLISKGARREPGSSIPSENVRSINTVFANAEYLISDRKFYWSVNSFRSGKDSIDHNFGPNDAALDDASSPIDDILNDLNQRNSSEESEEEPSES